MRKQGLYSIFGLLTLLTGAGQSQAAVIVSNLNATVNGTSSIYASGPPQEYAQEFSTGGSSFSLASIVAPVGEASGLFTPSAELVGNISGQPASTIVATFTVPTIPTGAPSDLTFIPNSSVVLSPDTEYWFILSATGSTGDYKWDYTDTNSASLPLYAVSDNNGSSWSVYSNGPEILEVNSAVSTSTPESSSLLLSGLAIAGLGLVMKRKSLTRH